MILRNVSLKKYNTFGVDYKADCIISIRSEKDAISVLKNRGSFTDPIFILGGGSNILFTKDFKGTIIHPENVGIFLEKEKKDYVIVSSDAGVLWDDLVEWTVSQGYGGLENLSLIPGLTGATPIQNIGAYGVEVKETIEKIRTVALSDGAIKEFSNNECRFGYRDSIFKGELKGKYLVTKVFFRLTTRPMLKTEYGSLKEEAGKLGPLSLKTIRQAVINIRRSRLPDPQITGNAGSFFKNPVIEATIADDIKKKYPGVPYFNDADGFAKIAAGWLIDQCGWKGKRVGNAGVHDKQALVLVNYGNATGNEIFDLSEAVKKSVSDKFGIVLQREVEVI